MAPLDDFEVKEFRRLIRRIEKIRRDLNWPQQRVAEVFGISQESYSRWINGRCEPASPLVVEGIRSKLPNLIAELRASQKKIEKFLKEIKFLESRR